MQPAEDAEDAEGPTNLKPSSFRRVQPSPMRRACCAIAVMLALAGLAPACVAGWDGQPATLACRAARRCLNGKADKSIKPAAANKCGLRVFVQLQFARLAGIDLS